MGLRTILVLGACMWCCGLAVAAPDARRVLIASPVDEILADMPASLSVAMRQSLAADGELSADEVSAFAYFFSKNLRGWGIEQTIVEQLDSELSAKQLQAVYDWYQTPAGQQIVQAERGTLKRQSGEQQTLYWELNRQYRGTAREKSYTRFARKHWLYRDYMAFVESVSMAFRTPLAKFGVDDYAPEFQKLIERDLRMSRGELEQELYDDYLYVYRNVAQDTFEQYLLFLESEAGRAYNRVLNRCLKEALTKSVQQVMDDMIRYWSMNSAADH